MLSDFEITQWLKAGQLAGKALAFGKTLIKPNESYLTVVEQIEKFVRGNGGELAFPINISVNDIAAHDAPMPMDLRCFDKNDVIKLDVGVHVNGYIGDNAVTVDLSGKYTKLCEASLRALEAVLPLAVPGTPVKDLGACVEEVIRKMGFLPIKNLGGHQMNVFKLHCGVFVPNFQNKDKKLLEAGMVLAIEPFAAESCDGVKDGKHCYIFNLEEKTPSKIHTVEPTYSTLKKMRDLPFSLRDLFQKLPEPIVMQQMEALDAQQLIHFYPPLITKNGCMVTQHEHTVIVGNPPIVTTKI